MRSRPDVHVSLSPAEPTAGKRLRAYVRLVSRSTTPYDAIDITLVGRESRYKRTVSSGKTSTRQYHKREILRLGTRFSPGVLEPGSWEQAVDFDLPHDAPPTFQSAYSAIAYELRVHVHIPWWPDRNEAYVVPVRVPSVKKKAAARPMVFTSVVGDRRGEEPILELSLEDQRLEVDGSLTGAVALSELGGRKIRRIELATSLVESPLVKSAAGPAEVARRTWKLHEGTPPEGASIPFRVAIPKDLVPTFHTPFIRVDYALEVIAVVAFGRDLSLRVPIIVERASSKRERARTGVPLVGKQRHLSVWRAGVETARIAGLPIVDFDPDQAVLVLDVRGIRVTVTEEHREGLGPSTVAELSFPRLGLDLRLCERRWTDLGGNLPGLDRKLSKRFTVRAREAAQATTLLGPGIREALEVFDEAAIDDEGAVVVQKGGVYQVSGLERFLSRVQMLANRLASAIATLPPPTALTNALPAWTSFAERHGAALCIGDLSISGLVCAGIPLSLDHRWEDDRPAETRIWAPRPEASLPASFNTALEKATGRAPLLEDTRVGIALPLVNDPDEVFNTAEALANTVAALSGATRLSPYR